MKTKTEKNWWNSNLHKAKKEKNDEFYTQIADIENELKHYKEHFKDKVFFVIVMILMKVIFSNILLEILNILVWKNL